MFWIFKLKNKHLNICRKCSHFSGNISNTKEEDARCYIDESLSLPLVSNKPYGKHYIHEKCPYLLEHTVSGNMMLFKQC